MATIPLSFDKLKSNHPSWQNIRSLVTNIPKIVDNTCAVQLSYALNRSDGVIGKYDYPDKNVDTGKVRAFVGNEGFNYIYSVLDLRVYLNNEYGDEENYKGNKQHMVSSIAGRQGILAFGHFHVDLWTGSDIHRPADYRPVLWPSKSVQLRGIFFWEVGMDENGPYGCALPGY
ncbi:MAG: T6SS effector amidase Tae4 family protein [Candidatus Methylumidiphilus sp.]